MAATQTIPAVTKEAKAKEPKMAAGQTVLGATKEPARERALEPARERALDPAGERATAALAPTASDAMKPGEAQPAPEEEDLVLQTPVARLPVEMDVAIPLPDFRVRHLLALEPGKVIESQWNYGNDVPLAAGAVQLAWTEFEVIDNQLAVRVTRLS